MADQGRQTGPDPVSADSSLPDTTRAYTGGMSPVYPPVNPSFYLPQASGPRVTGAVIGIPSLYALWRWITRHWLLSATLAALIAIVIVVGGAGLVIALHFALAKPDGYLYTSNTSVSFVQFTTDQNDHLAGTLQDVSATSSEAITTQESAFTGVLDGSQVSLTFSALGFSSTVTGTLNGNTLTLQIPDANGYMATDVFQGASVADYNNDVAQLRQRTAAYASATQEAEATVAAQSALDQAVSAGNSAVASDLSTLSSDTSGLAQDIDFSSAFGAYASTWQQMQADYQREQYDYQQGCGTYGANAATVQADAAQVQADLSAIQADDSGLQAYGNPAQVYISQISSEIPTLRSDWTALQGAVQADPGGSVAPEFTVSDVNSAITSAQQQVSAANSALQSAQNQARQYDTEAVKVATDAQNLANSMSC